MLQASQDKKLVLVLTTFTLMTGTRKAQEMRVPNKVFCICYLVQFQKNKDKDVLALLNFKSEINMMSLAYAA